jgi:uncharacterized membrane protein (UPF0127 family)
VPARPRLRHRATGLAVVAGLLVAGCATDPQDAPAAPTDPPAEATDPPAAPTDPPAAPTDPPAAPTDQPASPTDQPTDAPDVPPLHPDVDGWDATVVTLHGDDGTVRVDARVAATPEQRRRGLMHVPELPAGAGMLFVFEEERTGAFWMKDTLVALDIAFAGADGTVAAILTMTPCTADPCPTYDPEVAYTTALEVPAGWYASAGVEVGDALSWSEPSPADG